MFVVILSKRSSGKVSRKYFDTKNAAEEFVRGLEEKILRPRGNPGSKPTLRNHRIEIMYLEESDFIWGK